MNKLGYIFLAISLSILAVSCKSNKATPDPNADASTAVEYLITRAKGDKALVGRMLDLRETQIDSLVSGVCAFNDKQTNRVKEVYSYAISGKVSLARLKAKYDSGMKWYDKIFYWPITSPGWFWGITAFLLLFFVLNRMSAATDAIVTSPYTLSGIGGLLARVFFLIKNGFALEVLLFIVVSVLHFVL